MVLVGHSMAGMVITAYGERAPQKIKLMVYMSASVSVRTRRGRPLLRSTK